MLSCVTSNRQVFLKAFDFASQQQLKGIGSVDSVQNVLYSLSGKKGKKRERANQNLDPSGGECKDHTSGACHASFCKIAECDTLPSPGVNPLEGSPKCSCRKLGLGRRSRLPTLERGRGSSWEPRD